MECTEQNSAMAMEYATMIQEGAIVMTDLVEWIVLSRKASVQCPTKTDSWNGASAMGKVRVIIRQVTAIATVKNIPDWTAHIAGAHFIQRLTEKNATAMVNVSKHLMIEVNGQEFADVMMVGQESSVMNCTHQLFRHHQDHHHHISLQQMKCH